MPSSIVRCGVVLPFLLLATAPAAEPLRGVGTADEWEPTLRAFVGRHCIDCHSGAEAEAGLPLDRLATDLSRPESFGLWVKVHDQLRSNAMPPAEAPQPEATEKTAVLTLLAANLHAADAARQARDGRVQLRRLNRVEYESTLRDLFGLPNLEVADILPADGTAHGFDNVGSALNLSYVQMARYLEAADVALDAAMQLGPPPATVTRELLAAGNGRFGQVLRKGNEAVPIGEAVGLLRQPNTAQAPWTWSKIDPPAAGTYRIRTLMFGFVWDRGEVLPGDRPHVVNIYAFRGTTKRPLAVFDVPASEDEAVVIEFSAHLEPGDQIEIRMETLDDRNKSDTKPLDEYTAPGVAVEWLEVTGPLIDDWPPAGYRRLFGDLPSEPWTAASGVREPPLPFVTVGVGKRAERQRARRNKVTLYHVVSQNPADDARRLLHDFAERALRRPVADDEIAEFVALVDDKLDQRLPFQEAIRIGYQAILCSPEFLFFREQPGRLDDYALASRLSYFLWSSLPDDELLQLAERGELSRPDVLRNQAERMLDDARSARFVENFTGQWLDLRRITVTEPDEQLYPEFDRLLLDAMTEETHAYFREMLRGDLGVDHLVDSDFAMLNGRLATLYGIPDVGGIEIRRVELPADSPRGGFLTQASVLKVTANGTTTSPVTRGAWVLDRLLGRPAPPPPPNVPAVEPDLRGTTTIREQLAQHREDASCARCHRDIDPPGFALESFDVIGGWRDRYRSLEIGDTVDTTFKNNRPVRYKLGLPVDASGEAPGGERFRDVTEFRGILLGQRDQLARNLAERLLVYATGGDLQFADRAVVESILDRSRDREFGLRTLIHEVVQSKAFRSK